MQHRWMKRFALAVAALAMVVPLVGQSVSAATRVHSPVTLIWFMRIDSNENPWEKQQVAAFEATHPDIKINLILAPNPNGQFDAKFNTLLNSNHPADIWSHLGQAGFSDYYHRGLLYNEQTLIQKYGYNWGSTPKNLINTYAKGSGLYGIPSITLGSYLFYNKDLWDAYNAAHPNAKLAYPPVNWDDHSWTWAKMVADAKALSQPSKHVYGIVPGLWPPMANAFLAGTDMFPKGAYINGTPKSVNMTQPAIENIYQQIANWANKDKIAPAYSDQKSASNNGIDLFTTGKIAMEPTGGWGFRNYNTVKFHWAAGALPYSPSNKDVLFTDPYMLYKNTPYPQQAFEFIKFLTSKPAMESYVREVAFTPANPDFLGLWYKQVAAKTGMSQEGLKTLVAGARKYGQESPNHLIVNFSEIVNKMSNDIDVIMFGTKTAAQQMPVVQSDIDNVLAQTH